MSAHVELLFKTQNTSYKTAQPTRTLEGTTNGHPVCYRRAHVKCPKATKTDCSTTSVLYNWHQTLEVDGWAGYCDSVAVTVPLDSFGA